MTFRGLRRRKVCAYVCGPQKLEVDGEKRLLPAAMYFQCKLSVGSVIFGYQAMKGGVRRCSGSSPVPDHTVDIPREGSLCHVTFVRQVNICSIYNVFSLLYTVEEVVSRVIHPKI
jgi:hypothetical protein